MKVLIINVALRPDSRVKMFPVGLGYIATAVSKEGYDLEIIDIDAHRYSDEELEKLICGTEFDVLCLGCIVTGYKIIKEISALVRRLRPATTIVAGNTVASSVTETLLSKTEVDVAVLAEGDITTVELLKTLDTGGALSQVAGIAYTDEDGKQRRTAPRPVIENLDDHFTIEYRLFPTEIYIENAVETLPDPVPIPREEIRMLPVNTARGCVSNCTFCYHAFKEKRYRRRSPSSILAEVGKLQKEWGINWVGFFDELTFFKKEQAEEFSQAVLDSGLKFYWAINCRAGLFDSSKDKATVKKMREAGCLRVLYSLESADEEILRMMKKRISLEQFATQTRVLREAGMAVGTSLVFGYPQETPETIARTFDVCIENRIYPSSGYLLPQPGSAMYEYARDQGLIGDEEEYLLRIGDRQDLHVNLTRMSDREFQACVEEGAKRCNEELGVGLTDGDLIKTTRYRQPREPSK